MYRSTSDSNLMRLRPVS